MAKLTDTRLGVRVAFYVNVFLLFIVLMGIGFFYWQYYRQEYANLVQRGKILSMVGAKGVSRIMEEAVDNGILRAEDLFDANYQMIQGASPPKYRTQYDSYLDKAILKLQDEFLEDSAVLYAVSVDANGYVPTHNTRYQQNSGEDTPADIDRDRSKRISSDPFTVTASKNMNKGFVQQIASANGSDVCDVSSPILLKGRYWGFFKVGMTTAPVHDRAVDVMKSLLIGGFVFLCFSGGIIYWIVNRALKPLVEFAGRASDLADGDVDRKITFRRKDEIGQVAEALERLRISLQAAIERLMRR